MGGVIVFCRVLHIYIYSGVYIYACRVVSGRFTFDDDDDIDAARSTMMTMVVVPCWVRELLIAVFLCEKRDKCGHFARTTWKTHVLHTI